MEREQYIGNAADMIGLTIALETLKTKLLGVPAPTDAALSEIITDRLDPEFEVTDKDAFQKCVSQCGKAFMFGMAIGSVSMTNEMLRRTVEENFDECLKVVEKDEL